MKTTKINIAYTNLVLAVKSGFGDNMVNAISKFEEQVSNLKNCIYVG
jgi:hypothetical protein